MRRAWQFSFLLRTHFLSANEKLRIFGASSANCQRLFRRVVLGTRMAHYLLDAASLRSRRIKGPENRIKIIKREGRGEGARSFSSALPFFFPMSPTPPSAPATQATMPPEKKIAFLCVLT